MFRDEHQIVYPIPIGQSWKYIGSTNIIKMGQPVLMYLEVCVCVIAIHDKRPQIWKREGRVYGRGWDERIGGGVKVEIMYGINNSKRERNMS